MATIQRLRLTQFTVSHSKIVICVFFQNVFTSVTIVSYERPCFTKKKLASMGYSQVNCTNPKTGIDSEIIELKIFKTHI